MMCAEGRGRNPDSESSGGTGGKAIPESISTGGAGTLGAEEVGGEDYSQDDGDGDLDS